MLKYFIILIIIILIFKQFINNKFINQSEHFNVLESDIYLNLNPSLTARLRPLLITKPLISYRYTPLRCQGIHLCNPDSLKKPLAYLVINESDNILDMMDTPPTNPRCKEEECPYFVKNNKNNKNNKRNGYYKCYKCKFN